ncbi:MAG: S1/P1 nuclease [Crocinitomicaceae bacterium]|nr:S1/P1 nuclease [Crocinitomicaceae bacterium]
MNAVKIISVILLAGCCSLFPSKLSAWGKIGHRIVAGIAEDHLAPGVADSVQLYLGDMTMKEAATWMDEVRSDTAYNYLKPMHYINVEKGELYVRTFGPNILNELYQSFKILCHRSEFSKEEVFMAMKKVIHLAGDLGQPLHVGYGEDRGGNLVEVTFIDKKSNLHKVWDSDIIERQAVTQSQCTELMNNWSKRKIHRCKKINFEKWMSDSRSWLPLIYQFDNATIDQKYVDKVTPVLERQLIVSGLRLSALLNTVFA